MDFTALLKFDEFLSDLKTTPTASFLKGNNYLAALATGSGPMARGGAFHTWLKNWPLLKDRQELNAIDGNVKDAANALQMSLKDPDGFGQGIPLDRWVQNLVDWMEKFVSEANKFLSQMTDERFTYRGLKVSNPDRLPEPVVRKLLSGIDYVIAIFKKRGMMALLDQTLDKVVLRHQKPEDENNAGWFHWSPTGGIITLMSETVDNPNGGRFLADWVNEVFLHEVGHHVHLSLMDREARQEWNSGWAPVTQAKEAQDKIRKVQPDERKRFWDILMTAKGDLKKVKLKGLDRMKFHAWLANPQTGGSVVAPKQLRWSKAGESMRDFILDPETVMRAPYGSDQPPWEEIERKVASRWRQMKSKLGVSKEDESVAWPILTPEQVQEYAASDNQVEKAIDALEVPSSYARTNEKEDFAESFVAYMDAPEKLSKQALFRMRRALWLSGFAGKPIMKTVAKLVAEARVLLLASTLEAVDYQTSDGYGLVYVAEAEDMSHDDIPPEMTALQGKVAWIQNVYSTSPRAGTGSGTRLMKQILRDLQRRGVSTVCLQAMPYLRKGKGLDFAEPDSDEEKRLVSWYKKLGFRDASDFIRWSDYPIMRLDF